MINKFYNLPPGDHTPANFELPSTAWNEVIKGFIRRRFYPLYNIFLHHFIARTFNAVDFSPDLWFWGQRGNDYARHRARVARYAVSSDCRILVAGCGTARDVESWLKLGPAHIAGVDWFSYNRAWMLWTRRFEKIAPQVDIKFSQADLVRLTNFADSSFDLVGSDAVLEHVKDLPAVLDEFYRVLKPGGVLYAAFGPLWYGYGGDHVSGYDSPYSGYNHLLLTGHDYEKYIEAMGPYSHSEHDGRTWIAHDLFSRLKPREYLAALKFAGFERLFVGAVIDPLSRYCLRDPVTRSKLLAKAELLDLQVSAMSIIYRKPY